MKNEIILSLILLIGFGGNLQSQTITAPNSALKSHETLIIKKIEISGEKTEIYLSIENRITGGNFCADRKIYISCADGSRINIKLSIGIPVCPDTYKFTSVGERLEFLLIFPPLKNGTVSFDLVEDCQANCFAFYGVIVDPELNTRIDEAYTLAEKNQPAQAMVSFSKMYDEYGRKDSGAAGLFLINLVKLSSSSGNKVKAAEWYRKLESSDIPEKDLYLKHLNSQGLKF
jgi:hypothetical protein